MNEEEKERMKKWRTDQIAKYAQLENEIALGTNEMVTDPDLIKLMKEQAKLNDMIALGKEFYTKTIASAREMQADIKIQLNESWTESEDKTFKCDAGTATRRMNRSLNIVDTAKLVEFLTTLKKLPNFIKTFEISKLRKLKDAGLLGDEIVSYEENPTVAIKIAEAEQ